MIAELGETKPSLYHADKIQSNSFKAREIVQILINVTKSEFDLMYTGVGQQKQ